MKLKYIKSFLRVVVLQWHTSKLSVIWSLLFSSTTGLVPLAQAFSLAKLIASVSAATLQNADVQAVYFWLVALLIIELFGQIISNLDSVIRTRYQQKLELITNEKFFNKMYELSQEQFENEAFNTKLDRARDSLFQIHRVLDELSWAASQLIGFVGSIVVIIAVSPWIGLLTIATVVPTALLQIKQNKIREAIYKKIEPVERVVYRTRWMLIDPENMPEIRLMNGFKRLISSWKTNLEKSNNVLHDNNKRMVKYDIATSMLQPLVGFGATIYFFRLLLAGTIGLDRFIFLRGMLEQANNSAMSTANAVQRLHELSINLSNFDEVYDTPPAISDGVEEVARPLTIEFKNVSFSYPGSKHLILDDISFLIVPGSKLALVGENGAGKTTLIKLLLRQYLPTKGTITINGTNIRDVKRENYIAAISTLSQDFLIIPHLPIRDNLIMGLERDASDKDIYQTTDLVGATDFLKKLPHKLDSRLDTSFDEGTNLSGGQKQRLGVARALLRNADLMILDEPTSAIDAKAEFTIFNNIYQSHAGKTTLIVSHRFSTVRKADRIIVLEHGKIIEYGSHEELLKHNGLYKEMFETQAEGYK